MLNRRFLRIKALQEIYAYRQSNEHDLAKAERHLLQSVDMLYALFVYQLSFWVEVKRFAERRIEENRNKLLPTKEDLNPNLKFVNNLVLNALDNNNHLIRLEQTYKINWADHREDFIRSFYNRMLEFPEYKEYMSKETNDFEGDRRLLMTIIDKYMPEDSLLYDFYSDRDLAFNSDYQLALYLTWKFLNDLPASFNENSMLPPAYKTQNEGDEDDKTFVVKLFEKTLLHADEYVDLVKDNISNWDYDRLALMDRILIFMAMTEFCEFHFIPVKVTINEYIEISKYYSTPDSRRFVNGMLDRMAILLKEKGKLVKTGIGLIDK